MSVLQKLTEGIVNRDLKKEGAALLSKWNSTGLLEGLGNESTKHTMARLLENQAKELLREASTMSGGDVEGFAAVAFPIVRRVFGGLVANQLVSVQPMSLPSGLIFFMDFTFDDRGPTRLSAVANASLYGGGKVGQQITGGVDLSGVNAEKSFYSLNNGYSSPTGSTTSSDGATVHTFVASGTWDGSSAVFDSNSSAPAGGLLTVAQCNQVLQWDLGLVSGAATTAGTKTADGGTSFAIAELNLTGTIGNLDQFNFDDLVSLVATNGTSPGTYDAATTQARRLTCFSGTTGPNSGRNDTNKTVYVVGLSTTLAGVDITSSMGADGSYSYPITDNFGGTPAAGASSAIGAVVGDDAWGLENNQFIPEIDLKVDSVSVTAITKKLKAKWTPELGQDLNAYHNLDAEVELTSILSEQIALEIDQEILEDLVKGATASTYYWSRSPGLFVNRETGAEVGASAKAPDFTGTVSEWYETLIETVNDVSAQIHRKTLRGGANFIVTSPEVANILEFTAGFRASVTADDNKGIAGAEKVGSISKKFEVYVDPYFVRNLLLVGRKGNSFLESGYVYAPYVPLQVTPTIFGVEDFVPRKGVMTRYAKKMVRPDMYGLVVVRGLLGESGT